MNILNAFTRRSLAENRSRTLVTIIGIVLSMALFTAAIEGAYSGQQFLLRAEIIGNGSYMLYYCDVPDELAEELLADGDVKQSTEWRRVGWAEIESQNDGKPYLLIKSIDENFQGLVALHLTGRMPENAGEILLPNHLATNGGVKYALGDVLTLSVGRRTFDGEDTAKPSPMRTGLEQIADAAAMTYTVVGFYERFDYNIESIRCPGYTALTVGGGARGVFLELKSAARVNGFEQRYPFGGVEWHRDLLSVSGELGGSNMATVLYHFRSHLCGVRLLRLELAHLQLVRHLRVRADAAVRHFEIRRRDKQADTPQCASMRR